jgi:hypothetical protein
MELALPSNCWVEGNPPIPYEQTVQDSDERTWDIDYKRRSRNYPMFLATDALFCELRDPPRITDEALFDAFGRVPGPQNPPDMSEEHALRLLGSVGIDL